MSDSEISIEQLSRHFKNIFPWKNNNKYYFVRLDEFFTKPIDLWKIDSCLYYLLKEFINNEKWALDARKTENILKFLSNSLKVTSGDFESKTGKYFTSLCSKFKKPFLYGIEITNKCNFKCRYCYLKHEKKPEMSATCFKKCVDNICEADGLIINVTGGEPSVSSDLVDNLGYAIHSGLAVVVRTNLYKLPKGIETFAGCDRIAFIFSFHNIYEAKYDLFVGKNGGFKNLTDNIKKLKQFNIKHCAQVVLTSENQNSIKEILEWLTNNNVPHVINEQIFPSIQPKGLVDDNHCFAESGCVSQLISEKLLSRGRTRCTATTGKLWIGSDGTVYPCEFMKNNPIGDLTTAGVDLIGITNGELADSWRTINLKYNSGFKEECNACEHKQHCPACPAFVSLGNTYLEAHCRRTREIMKMVNI